MELRKVRQNLQREGKNLQCELYDLPSAKYTLAQET